MSDAGPVTWRREGMLYPVKSGHSWWVSHAQTPTVLPFSERLWRIYFAARDRSNVAHIAAVDVDPLAGMRIVAEHLEPLIERGPPGAFDHEGMGPSSALAVDGRVLLFYTGVSVRKDVRFQLSIGLATSTDGLRFEKAFPGPIRSSGPRDPCFASTPTVMRTSQGVRMWYASGIAWREFDGALEPLYDIKTSHSADGVIWDGHAKTAIALTEPADAGLGRPWVVQGGDGMRIWYSKRGAAYRGPGPDAYRIVSSALDENGLGVGAAETVTFANPPRPGDFDDGMQCYACLVPHGNDLVMFYNGNDFGRAGFGWARAEGAHAAGGLHGGR